MKHKHNVKDLLHCCSC